MARFRRAKVEEHTRLLANGTKVTVHSHDRSYTPAAATDSGVRSPVENHRRARVKVEAKDRRQEALARAGVAARKGGTVIRKRGKQGAMLARDGAKRLGRAGRYAARKRRAMAVGCAIGGTATIAAGLAWSLTGIITTILSILLALITGGLLIGGSKRAASSPPPRPTSTRRRPPAKRPTGKARRRPGIVHPAPAKSNEPASETTRNWNAFQKLSRMQDEAWESRRQEARRRRTQP